MRPRAGSSRFRDLIDHQMAERMERLGSNRDVQITGYLDTNVICRPHFLDSISTWSMLCVLPPALCKAIEQQGDAFAGPCYIAVCWDGRRISGRQRQRSAL